MCDMTHIRLLFDSVDTNGDLSIDKDEFAQFVRMLVKDLGSNLDQYLTRDDIDATFDFIDINHNGDMEFCEFEDFLFTDVPWDEEDTSEDGSGLKTILELGAKEKKEKEAAAAAKAEGGGAATNKADEVRPFESAAAGAESGGAAPAAAEQGKGPDNGGDPAAADRIRELIQGASDCANLKTLFDTVDKDSDGHIQDTEFGAFVDGCVAGTAGASPPAQGDITACFKFIDLDGNGLIEFVEFERFLQYSQSQCYSRIRHVISGACNTENLEELFKTVDTDSDGCISPVEFSAFVEGCCAGFPGGHAPVSKPDVDATFSYIDTNGNGQIEFDEFEYFFFVRKKSEAGKA